MTIACPQCAGSDQIVGVPHALTNPTPSLGWAEHSALLPPPAPAPVPVARSKAAVVLYTVAGVIGALMLMNLGNGVPGPEEADTAYRVGYVFGPLILAVPLALVGLAVQLVTKQRRTQAAADGAKAQHSVWERRHRLWQAALLCLRCRVCFVPAGALGPESAASPALAVAHLPMWVAKTADQGVGAPELASPR